MPDFFQTMMGKKFYESDFPRLVNSMETIARSMEQSAIRSHAIETINVIVRNGDEITAVYSYPATVGGNLLALEKRNNLVTDSKALGGCTDSGPIVISVVESTVDDND